MLLVKKILLFFAIIPLGVFSQNDSIQLKIISKRLDSISNILNSKIVPFIDASSKVEIDKRQLVIDNLTNEKAKLSSEISTIKEKLDNANNLNIQNSDQLKKISSSLDSKTLLIEKQKELLKNDILNLTNQDYRIEESFLNGIKERIKNTEGIDNSFSNILDDFINKRTILIQIEKALNAPFDSKISVLINDAEDIFSKGTSFKQLSKFKEKMLPLLKGYCQKTEDLKNVLIVAADLNILPDERKRVIKKNLIDYIGYDYLVNILIKNMDDYNHNPIKNSITNCK
jgi:hypothetical protein